MIRSEPVRWLAWAYLLIAPVRAQELEHELERIRRALGSDAQQTETRVWRGAGSTFGAPVTCELVFDGAGRFRWRASGPTGDELGFDGTRVWSLVRSEGARTLALEERELALITTWFETGHWLAPAASLEIELVPDEGTTATAGAPLRLALRLRGGLRTCTVLVDRESARPLSLSYESTFGPETWSLSGWLQDGPRLRPGRVEHGYASGLRDAYDYGTSAARPASDPPAFQPLRERPSDARFDPELPEELAVETLSSGHLMVRPTIQGREVGWFVFDSGAAVSVIQRSAALELGLEPYGQAFLGGAGAEQLESALYDGRDLRLGNLAIDAVQFFELEENLLAPVTDLPIGGILGYDVFHRAVVRVRMDEPLIALEDPARYELPEGATWSEFVFHTRHVVVKAAYEGQSGRFRLDTGAGAMGVLFNGPTVEAKRLLEGREVFEGQAVGAGGPFPIHVGSLSTLEIGGLSLAQVPAIFSGLDAGAASDPYTDGVLGSLVLERFEIVFDYANQRLAWIVIDG